MRSRRCRRSRFSTPTSPREEAAAGNRAADLLFWAETLAGRLPILDLACDKPRPKLQSFKGSSVWFDLPRSLCARLQALAAERETTFFVVILAAFQTILHRYSGEREIIVGTPVANRTVAEVRPLIGNFLNMVALRSALSSDLSFAQVLEQARAVTLDAFSHREAPFQQVVRQLRFHRDPSRNPIFQVMLQVLPRGPLKLGDLEVSDFHFDAGFAQLDLSLHLYETAEGYTGRFEYCSDLFERDTVEDAVSDLLNTLERIVADPDTPISSIPLLGFQKGNANTEGLPETDAGAGQHSNGAGPQTDRTPFMAPESGSDSKRLPVSFFQRNEKSSSR